MAPKKRKQADIPTTHHPKRSKPPATAAEQATETKTCYFLEKVPGEIRNMIYEQIMALQPVARLHRSSAHSSSSRRALASSSALVRVNKQIRAEFLELAIEQAPIVEITVRNWDFAHVITFLNRMDDAELARFLPEADDVPAERVLEIKLFFVGDGYIQGVWALRRWLRRTVNRDKKGAGIDYQYEIVGGEAIQMKIPSFFDNIIPRLRARLYANARREEQKIMSAVKAYNREASLQQWAEYSFPY